MIPIAPHIVAFLRQNLAHERGASQHTCDSYACTFQLLFEFAAGRLRMTPSSLALEQLDAILISDFLEYLEDTRQNSPATRNVRLAAIRSFFHFLEYREPAILEQARRILGIPYKKTDSRLVPYLGEEEVQALLDAPDPSTREGIRDRAMLHLAICAGLRVSELTGLQAADVVFPSMSIRVHGKGRRERALPLWKTTANALRAWIAVRGTVAVPELFVNARGEAMSRWGFAYILKCHAETARHTCPSLSKKQVSPHVLRHYVPFLTMSGDPDERPRQAGDCGLRRRRASQSHDIVSSVQQSRGACLPAGSVLVRRVGGCLRKGLLLHLKCRYKGASGPSVGRERTTSLGCRTSRWTPSPAPRAGGRIKTISMRHHVFARKASPFVELQDIVRKGT